MQTQPNPYLPLLNRLVQKNKRARTITDDMVKNGSKPTEVARLQKELLDNCDAIDEILRELEAME